MKCVAQSNRSGIENVPSAARNVRSASAFRLVFRCFGHFHINRKFLLRETKFRRLAEMAAFEVVSCDQQLQSSVPGKRDRGQVESGAKVGRANDGLLRS